MSIYSGTNYIHPSKRNRRAEVLDVLTKVMTEIQDRTGQEFYRRPYDQAIKVRVALKDAGFNIVKARKQKEH